MADGGALVRADGLGKRYGAQWASRGVTFEVRRGEIFGVIGPNGAGKTTTLKMLAGLVEPSEGALAIDGHGAADPGLKRRVGYLPEESPLYEDMTPEGYLRFFADLYEVPRDVARERIASLLGELGLDTSDGKRIGDMSKGMRRKVAIARALVHDPDLLVFDEPASGLDPVVSASVIGLVRRLAAAGKTVVFSAHNLYHVERICDRVLILRRGEVVVQGSMREIRAAHRGTEYVVRFDVPVPGAARVEDGFELKVADFGEVAGIEAKVVESGGRILDVRENELSLEEIFLRASAR